MLPETKFDPIREMKTNSRNINFSFKHIENIGAILFYSKKGKRKEND